MKYLLPCDQCGEKTAIDTSQAGREIVCQCGASLVVPSFRAIRALEVAGESPAPTTRRRKWNPMRGATFALGLVIVAIGLFIAVVAGIYWYQTDTSEVPGPDVSQAAAELDKLDATEVLEIWNEMHDKGIGPYLPPPHFFARQWAERCQWLALIGMAVAVFGAFFCAGPVIASKIRRA
jgi:hypothetical protein